MSGRARAEDTLRVRAAAIVLAVCGMLWIGPYTWPTSDHAQDILPVLARLDPSLYTRDFAVQSFLGPSPRVVYQWVIAGLMRTGLSAAWASFVCQLATLVAAAVMALFTSRWIARRFDTIVVLSAMVWLALLFPAASHFNWHHPIVDTTNAVAGTFAMGFALWGWYHALRRHWGAAYALFGLAALLQVLVGFIGGLLLFPMLVADFRQGRSRRARWIAGVGVWIACGIAIAFPMLSSGPALDSAELVRIFGYVRAPHHWLPSSAGEWYWANQLLLALGAVLIGQTLRPAPMTRRLRLVAVVVIAGAAACLLANYVFVERYPVALVAKLQFQRTLPFAHLAIILLCVATWQQMLRHGRIVEGIVLMVIPIARIDGAALALFAGGQMLRQRGRPVPASILVLASAIVALSSLPSPARYPVPPAAILAFAIGLAVIGLRRQREGPVIHAVLARGAIAAGVITIVAVLFADNIAARWGWLSRILPTVESYRAVPVTAQDLAALLRREIPRDALVLMSPEGEVQFVPLLSERSVVVSWKNIPYTDAGIAEWDRRITRSVGRPLHETLTDTELRTGWSSLPESDLVDFSRAVGAEYVVSRDEWHRFPQATVVGRAGGWTVWRMR